MKKRLAVLLAASMVLALVGCGSSKSDDKKETSSQDINIDNNESEDNANAGEQQDGTTGEILLKDFLDKAEDASLENKDIADAVVSNPIIQFKSMVIEVEPGFLNGFNSEISGFESGVMFSPSIGSIPFVGYVFTVADEASVDSFIETLKTEANLRWLICAEADEMVVDHVGNKVFFLMCNSNLEE